MTMFAEERRVQKYAISPLKQAVEGEGVFEQRRTSRFPPDVPPFFSGGDHLSIHSSYAGSAWANGLLIVTR